MITPFVPTQTNRALIEHIRGINMYGALETLAFYVAIANFFIAAVFFYVSDDKKIYGIWHLIIGEFLLLAIK